MNILDTIVEQKRAEVLERKQSHPLSRLGNYKHYRRRSHALSPNRSGEIPGIIAEFKRRSPSRGIINAQADPVKVALAYQDAGVAGMSILTDQAFFGGSLTDLLQVREACPDLALLRKDFIIDAYQLHEASAHGADMVLLIAAILDQREVEDLALEADTLGLQVLFEVHDRQDLEKYHKSIPFVGVNNRDLKSFRVDTGRSLELLPAMPPGVIPVSESGLSDPEEVRRLRRAGYKFFLMGENFMKQHDPGQACKKFIGEL